MKAERRHELKQNSLEKTLESAPVFFQLYGSRILLGLVLCLLAYILVHNHYVSKAENARISSESLGTALYYLDQLRSLPPASPERVAPSRNEFAKEVEENVAKVLARAEDPKLKAQALIARGDANWILANFPSLPGSATRPAELNVDKPAADLLKLAEDSYKQVLEPPLNEDHASVVAAQMGLGYIAENREQWDAARQSFQKVIDGSASTAAEKEFATHMVEMTRELEKPVLLASSNAPLGPSAPSMNIPKPPAASFIPSALPSDVLGPSAPTTSPAVGPFAPPAPAAAPTTAPTTAPIEAAPAVSAPPAVTPAPATQPATAP